MSHKMKCISFMLVFLCFLTIGNVAARSEGEISLKVNGMVVQTDAPPTIVEGRTMVPVRFIAEALGIKVDYNEATGTVIASGGGTEVSIIIGGKAYENNQEINSDAAAFILNGRTMVPVRLIGEAFGAEVRWDDSTRTVDIVMPGVRDDNRLNTLLGNLNHSDPAVRIAAAKELGLLGDSRAVASLIKTLGDSDMDVCQEAAMALGQIKDCDSVDPLITCLDDHRVRRYAAIALAEIGDPRAIDPFITHMLAWDADPTLKTTIARFGSAAVPALMTVLESELEWQRDSASAALANIGTPALDALAGSLVKHDPQITEGAVKALVHIADSRVDELLLAVMMDKNNTGNARDLAFYHFITAYPEDKLITALKTDLEFTAQHYDRIMNFRSSEKYQLLNDALLHSNIDERTGLAMARAFLNSGQESLIRCAQTWAIQHHYQIRYNSIQP